VLADTKRWRRFLARPGWAPWCRRGTWCGDGDHRSGNRHDLLVLLILLVIVVDLDDHPDLDLDLVGVVQLNGITFDRPRDGGLRFVLVGVDGGVDWFLGHSGSYVTDR
jgi:hypothetical protein